MVPKGHRCPQGCPNEGLNSMPASPATPRLAADSSQDGTPRQSLSVAFREHNTTIWLAIARENEAINNSSQLVTLY
jgi:hypothetical protein